MQHTGDRAELPRSTLAETLQAVELSEQLVGAVDQVDDHGLSIWTGEGGKAGRREGGKAVCGMAVEINRHETKAIIPSEARNPDAGIFARGHWDSSSLRSFGMTAFRAYRLTV
jgi:hypothetical protein